MSDQQNPQLVSLFDQAMCAIDRYTYYDEDVRFDSEALDHEFRRILTEAYVLGLRFAGGSIQHMHETVDVIERDLPDPIDTAERV